MPTYKLREGSIQEKFMKSRAKVQILAGGFANGKTSASCIKVLEIIKDYPKANICLARATRTKLMSTLAKEFFKWCPPHWIKSYNKTDGTIIFENGTTLDLKYIRQQGKNAESSTSNLLSANYDCVVIDQIEDPEIEEKDFYDLLGRLRSNAKYIGKDPTMPVNGTRWLILTCNPTRNWVYHKLVRPYHIYKETGKITEDLLYNHKTKQCLIEVIEGSTYENAENLEPDYIEMLEASYTGTMKDRFLLGNWGAFEGLVYKDYNDIISQIHEQDIRNYLDQLEREWYNIEWIEGYDYGIAVPSCYLLAFTDPKGNVIIVDGFYEAELDIGKQVDLMNDIRDRWGVSPSKVTQYADPAIFKRNKIEAGTTINNDFEMRGIQQRRGANNIVNGITKVSSYFKPTKFNKHPITKDFPAPYLYFNSKLDFMDKELTTYRWKKSATGRYEDMPVDTDDHAMDALKYLLTNAPEAARIPTQITKQTILNSWAEQPAQEKLRARNQ